MRFVVKSAVWRGGKPTGIRTHYVEARTYRQGERKADAMKFKSPQRKIWAFDYAEGYEPPKPKTMLKGAKGARGLSNAQIDRELSKLHRELQRRGLTARGT